ncbi:MAG: nucleoside triphosphate hydrolase [Alphaproteobacteria bacterium]|nr:nucleoside triphosphate hydrolase [Alphaproteobacteria bacterium]
MIDPQSLAVTIRDKAEGANRYMVAIAGPPGAGKSTLSEGLFKELSAMGEKAIVVPMDGFHFDDIILNARGHRPRKGAPFTFDVAGFESLLKRIRSGEPDIAIPVFDRNMELSRNAADIVGADARIILIEGNYLLLRESPWSRLQTLFDFTIMIDVPYEELERRLVQRWLHHGFDLAHAKTWIAANDSLNIRHVLDNSAPADLTV